MIPNKDYVPLTEITNVCSALVKKWDQKIANYKWGRCSFERRIAMWASQGFLNLYSCKPIPPSDQERWFFIDTCGSYFWGILHDKEETACYLYFVDESDHWGDQRDRMINTINRPELKPPMINIRREDLYLNLHEITRLKKEHPDFADSETREPEVAKIKKRHHLTAETTQARKLYSTAQLKPKKEKSNQCNINVKVEPIRVVEDENELPLKRQTTQELDTFLRLAQIIGNPKKGMVPIIPVSKSAWWDGVKSGRFPASIKLSERCTVWRLSDIIALQKAMTAKEK